MFSCLIVYLNSFNIINSSHLWITVTISSTSFSWPYWMCF
nr:MAG TPA: hypothetical protein [Bacteriophage sp.]